MVGPPAGCRPPAARRQPQRGRASEKSRRNARRAARRRWDRWLEALGGAGRPTTRHARRSVTPNRSRRARRPAGGGPGSEVSPVQLLQHVDVERGVGHELLQPLVLLAEFLQPLGVVGLHAAVPVPPPMPGRLGDLQAADTSSTDRPSPRSFSPSASSRISCSGVCRRCSWLGTSSPDSWGSDSHNRWISSRGPGQMVQAAIFDLLIVFG